MRLKLLVLVLLVVLLAGCQSTESGVLSPGQVTATMVDQVIKVKGKITTAVENPGGLGGMYLRLEDGRGSVGVRIQDDIWKPMTAAEKARFQEGEAITAEGVLFQAGRELVIIYGKTSPK